MHRSQFPQYFLTDLEHFGELMYELSFAEIKAKTMNWSKTQLGF
jgi:hypothetical protein